MTIEQALAVAGIALNLVGVVMLFRYGMPYHVETKGVVLLALEEIDHDEIKLERRYKILGKTGLVLIVVGSALQALAVLLV